MLSLSKFDVSITLLVVILSSLIVGQSINLGWGLPLGTTLTCFIAALGFGVAIYQSYATRKHNRLLVKPHLIFNSQFNSTTLDGHYTYTLKVKNVGLGPSIIDRYLITLGDTIELDGHTVFERFVTLVNEHFQTKGLAHCVAGFLHDEHALEKGEEKILLEVSFPKSDISFIKGREKAKLFTNLINTKIQYRCHYGHKFEISKKFT